MRVFRWLLFLLVLPPWLSATTPPRVAGKAPVAPSRRPNIIVITLDTTRADRMGFLGSTRGLTPNLDALAKQSVVFSRAYAQVPLTTPSHAAIFTGTYPQFNHLDYMGQPLEKSLPYLPDLLKKRGYHTAAFVGSFIIDPHNIVATGFGRGFDTYDANFHNRAHGEDRYQSVERRAEVVVDHALAWLKAHPQGPFLMWVHCYDAHAPYDPPPPYKQKYASELYDGEIAYTDSAMGKLFAGLKARGVYDSAVIAVMADHGEAFGEHGEHHHGIFLYDETIHVPLLFKLPGQQFAGKRVDGRVRLVDVTPTLLEEIGFPVPSAMQGQSLLNLIKGESGRPNPPDRPAYSESDYAHRAFGWSALRSWRTGKYLYVDAPEPELYDQSVDPHALTNLVGSAKAVADTMQAQSSDFRKKTSSVQTAQTRLSPEQSESLRALGYVGTDSSATAEGTDRGPDPKGKMEIAYLLDEALGAVQEEEFEAAIPKLQEVIQKEPNTALAYLELGRAYVRLNDYEKALPPLRIAVQKLPEDGLAHYALGQALVKTGNWAEAVPEFEGEVGRNPKSPQLHFELAVVYERSQRIPDAMREFRNTLQLDPKHFRANLLLGRLYGMQGDGNAALPYLRKAVALDPKSADAHLFLSSAYNVLGQTENARRERDESIRLRASTGPTP